MLMQYNLRKSDIYFQFYNNLLSIVFVSYFLKPNIYNFRAQNFYKRNLMSLVAAATVGVIVVFAVETILKVLKFYKFY